MSSYPFSKITDQEFTQFQKLIYEIAGIDLPPSKKMLVAGRLSRRLRHYKIDTYSEYFRLVTDPNNPLERQMMVDLLTTNETHFFREGDHFQYLRHQVLPNWHGDHAFRAWSAACSSGEEPYSIAMVLMDVLGENRMWEVVGSDISHRVLEAAQVGHYALETARYMPPEYLRKYCLKGVRSQAGTFLVDKKIRSRVNFQEVNLNGALPAIGRFDVIFLRNVLIYFNGKTKQQVVHRILDALRSGGYCFIGHSESLLGIMDAKIQASIHPVAPTIYRKR